MTKRNAVTEIKKNLANGKVAVVWKTGRAWNVGETTPPTHHFYVFNGFHKSATRKALENMLNFCFSAAYVEGLKNEITAKTRTFELDGNVLNRLFFLYSYYGYINGGKLVSEIAATHLSGNRTARPEIVSYMVTGRHMENLTKPVNMETIMRGI